MANPNIASFASLGGKSHKGRKQTPEHAQRRIESAMRKLASTTRNCVHCGNAFTPTGTAQRYCSGQCWNATHREKSAQRTREAGRIRLTPSQYKNVLELQGGVCAICGQPPEENRRLATDHCHTTGRIRGLLCATCNTAIGLMHDDTSRLKAAIAYLEK